MKTKNWKKEKKRKKWKNDDNEADSPKNKPMTEKIGVDRSKELKITEEDDVINWPAVSADWERTTWGIHWTEWEVVGQWDHTQSQTVQLTTAPTARMLRDKCQPQMEHEFHRQLSFPHPQSKRNSACTNIIHSHRLYHK